MALPSLTVAISTLGAALVRLDLSEIQADPGVHILILVQCATAQQITEANQRIGRDDVRIIPLNTIGVAHSRNAAIAEAATDILVFADDDLLFLPGVLTDLCNQFERRTEMDFACCRLVDDEGSSFKAYPKPNLPVTRTNCGRVGTPEIAIRLERISDANIKFDPSFGAGTSQSTGDEYIFLCDALKAGLFGRHLDLTVASHPGASSGHNWDIQSLGTREKVLRRALAPWSWPYRVGFAIKHRSKFPDFATLLRFIKP